MAELAMVEELMDHKIRQAFARYETERSRKLNNRLFVVLGALSWSLAIAAIVVLVMV